MFFDTISWTVTKINKVATSEIYTYDEISKIAAIKSDILQFLANENLMLNIGQGWFTFTDAIDFWGTGISLKNGIQEVLHAESGDIPVTQLRLNNKKCIFYQIKNSTQISTTFNKDDVDYERIVLIAGIDETPLKKEYTELKAAGTTILRGGIGETIYYLNGNKAISTEPGYPGISMWIKDTSNNDYQCLISNIYNTQLKGMPSNNIDYTNKNATIILSGGVNQPYANISCDSMEQSIEALSFPNTGGKYILKK